MCLFMHIDLQDICPISYVYIFKNVSAFVHVCVYVCLCVSGPSDIGRCLWGGGDINGCVNHDVFIKGKTKDQKKQPSYIQLEPHRGSGGPDSHRQGERNVIRRERE